MSKQAWVDARLITSAVGEDRSYPFSPAMHEVGYGLFEPLPVHPNLPPLWSLAISDDPEKRIRFIRVMDLFEGTDPLAPTIIDLAMSLYIAPKNPVSPIQLLDTGSKDGKQSYSIVAGERHVVAALWLWCKELWTRPVLQAQVLSEQEQERS